ncbi:MAG: hypothetical protein CMJ06_01465 [Pelagibacterales bacterium]|nr:hypothetical protein [Pelagibacterales bacterium]OUU63332.1 MAG: hypothetical protein CBC22_01435 [Alphaproteobacteria bacterium TMED62]
MFRLFFIFYIYIFTSISYGSEEMGNDFILQLLEWNIDYKKLDNFKSGAGCISKDSYKYQALGLSYNLADINFAKKIALEGCEQMKKKIRSLMSVNAKLYL